MGPVQKTMSTLSISEGPVKDCIKDTSSIKATSEGPVLLQQKIHHQQRLLQRDLFYFNKFFKGSLLSEFEGYINNKDKISCIKMVLQILKGPVIFISKGPVLKNKDGSSNFKKGPVILISKGPVLKDEDQSYLYKHISHLCKPNQHSVSQQV